MLDGLNNTLSFIDTNWSNIIICIGLILGLWKKIDDYRKKSTEEKIAIAKKQIESTIMDKIGRAETDYLAMVQAGSIKRAQVIDEIFKEYPVLTQVTNQEELVNWIDSVINDGLIELRKIFETNEKTIVVAEV